MNADPKELLKQYEPKELKVIKPEQQLCMARFSSCGKFLAAGDYQGRVRRWDVSQDEIAELAPLAGPGGWVQAICFHPEDDRLFAADSWGQVWAWRHTESEPKPAWCITDAHQGWIRDLKISRDGQWLATCGVDQRVRIISSNDGKRRQELVGHGEPVFAVAFHPDGKSVVSGDLKGVVKQWDLASGKPVREFDARPMYKLDRLQDVGGVRSLAFNAEGTLLACGGLQPKNGGNVQGAPTAMLFDWDSGKLKQTVTVGRDGDGFIYEQAFHADGFLMAVVSGNPGVGKLFFHQPGDEQPFFVTTKMANCHTLAVHPDGRRIVVGATNNGSNGNGRNLNKNGEYAGNVSPLHILQFPDKQA